MPDRRQGDSQRPTPRWPARSRGAASSCTCRSHRRTQSTFEASHPRARTAPRADVSACSAGRRRAEGAFASERAYHPGEPPTTRRRAARSGGCERGWHWRQRRSGRAPRPQDGAWWGGGGLPASCSPGIDVRADGGIVVLPPSKGVTERGKRWSYAWIAEDPLPYHRRLDRGDGRR
ncbi:MAG TPA: bifunctional DNA primase/polymerase [Kofleriaceae bacterium]|nr:bifunctional DNA primase/polymerase [Kofleriaceae bacterium]